MRANTLHIGAGMWLCAAILIASRTAEGQEQRRQVKVDVDLYSAVPYVGEPLVVTVTLRNTGETVMALPYAKPGMFNKMAPMSVTVHGPDGLVLSRRVGEYVTVLMPPSEPGLRPGEAVSAKRAVVLSQRTSGAAYRWVGPGTYRIRVTVALPQETVESRTVEFTVRPLPEDQSGALSFLPMGLLALLEGPSGRSSMEMKEATERLRKEYPHLPHLMYLDYALMTECEDAATYEVAGEAYLKKYPESPYRDNVLFREGQLQMYARHKSDAIRNLRSLIKGYPNSVLRAEAEGLLAKLGDSPEEVPKMPDTVPATAPSRSSSPVEDSSVRPTLRGASTRKTQDEKRVVREALWRLTENPRAEDLPFVRAAARDAREDIREQAVSLMVRFGRVADLDVLVKVLGNQEEVPRVRAAAARSLGRLEARKALPQLLEALEDASLPVREGAHQAIKIILRVDTRFQPNGSVEDRRAALAKIKAACQHMNEDLDQEEPAVPDATTNPTTQPTSAP